jgi:hypothetical protein
MAPMFFFFTRSFFVSLPVLARSASRTGLYDKTAFSEDILLVINNGLFQEFREPFLVHD